MFGTNVGSRLKRIALAVAGLTVAVLPVACDKEPTAPTMVVAGNTTLAASSNVANAVTGVPFVFTGGAGALDASVAGQNLTVTFGGTAAATTATLLIGTGTVQTTTTFGSCIFAVTSSTFPAGSKFAVGQTITVNPCNLSVNTTGAVANGQATSRSVALLLGAAASAGATVVVAVNAGGQLTLNGNTVGTVTLTPVSG